MASIVDEFDGDTQDRLYMLLWDMKVGERSDWFLPAENHIARQTCSAFLIAEQQFGKWKEQLADLLVDLKVESMLPFSRVDSPGDFWMVNYGKYRRWGETAA
jgi:hypothetical protein